MAPSAETPTQVQPTIPAPPSGGTATLEPRVPTPVIGGPGGGPPRPPKRPTGGGGGGGGGGDEPGGPGDDAARKRLTYFVAFGGIVILVIMFVLLHNSSGGNADTTPEGLPVATQSLAKAAAASTQTSPSPSSAPAATPASSSPAASSPQSTSTSPDGGVAIGGDDASTPATSGPLLQAGSVAKIKVKQGDTVTFQVKSATAQEVHVHGYDNHYDLAAGETKTISFKATITGIFDIEFEQTSTQIGELTVEP